MDKELLVEDKNNIQTLPQQGPKMISPDEVAKVQSLDKPDTPKVISKEEVAQVQSLDKIDEPKVISPEEVAQVQPLDKQKVPKVVSPEEIAKAVPQEQAVKATNIISPDEVAKTPSLDKNINSENAIQTVSEITNENNEGSKVSDGPKAISADEVKKESINYQVKTKEEEKKEKKELKKSLKKPKKKQKSDYVNFLLILAIFLLLSVIIAPPVLRKLMPEKPIKPTGKDDNAVILSCTGINQQEQYKINSRIKYIDEVPIQNIITYTKLDSDEVEKELKNYSLTTVSPSNEISFFRSIKGINVTTNSNITIVSIYDYIAEKNTGDFEFINHFQDENSQKSYYEGKGYTCERIKN